MEENRESHTGEQAGHGKSSTDPKEQKRPTKGFKEDVCGRECGCMLEKQAGMKGTCWQP